MTARGPVLKRSGTAMPETHYGWNGIPFMMSLEFSDHLEFCHLFGTDIPTVFPSSDVVSDKSTGDHSWNGRHGTNFGAVPGTESFVSGTSAFYQSSLTGDELATLGGGQWTVVTFANLTSATLSMVVGTHASNSIIDGWALGRNVTGGGNIQFTAVYETETEPTPLELTAGAWIGTGYEMLAVTTQFDGGVQEARLYAWNVTNHIIRQAAGAMVIPAAVGGPNPIRIGRSVGNNFTNPADIVGVWGFSHAFTEAELVTLHGSLVAFLASHGITVLS